MITDVSNATDNAFTSLYRTDELRIIIGENRERRAAWRREHPEVFFYERD